VASHDRKALGLIAIVGLIASCGGRPLPSPQGDGAEPAGATSVTPGFDTSSEDGVAKDAAAGDVGTLWLQVTWVPFSIGPARFDLVGVTSQTSPFGPEAPEIVLDCTFEGASGSGVVPHVLLSSPKMMSGTSSAQANLESALDATTVVGGLTIVTASFPNHAGATLINVNLQ
jgi:hypothetical protein